MFDKLIYFVGICGVIVIIYYICKSISKSSFKVPNNLLVYYYKIVSICEDYDKKDWYDNLIYNLKQTLLSCFKNYKNTYIDAEMWDNSSNQTYIEIYSWYFIYINRFRLPKHLLEESIKKIKLYKEKSSDIPEQLKYLIEEIKI